jgi:hypothetical protein
MKQGLRDDALKLKGKFVIFEQRMADLQTIVVDADKVEKVARNLASDAKITSKTVQDCLVSCVCAEFAGTNATAAEIVIAMIEAQNSPELADLSDANMLTLQKKLGEVPYQRIRANF